MADTKISDLVALTGGSVSSVDLLCIVDTSATTTKKIAIDQFLIAVAAQLTGTVAINITGTALNGVVTTGSYSDPAWITSLAGSKLTGTIVATNGVVTTGSYSDPAWITSLAGSKLTGSVVATNGVVTTGSYSDPAWITSLAGSKITGDISSNAANVTGTVAITHGGTGATTAAAGFDALSPMTTLGDTIYGAASGTRTRLAGNTTTTKKFITQTGDGTVSAAPSWSVVSSTDVGLGSVENTALSTWTGSTNITTLGTISTGTWSATTIAIAKGGTGATTQSAAFNALSPVTTLGDIIYGSGSNANSRLAGNTTTTKKFITQTGDGTISAAPSWSVVSSTDVGLGSVENTALSTWAGSTNLTTLGTITSGTWSATAIGITKGGTGQATASAGFNALSPVTTLGDIIYGSGSNANSRLAGNTTTTKKFITQTGDGTNSAAPSWGTVSSTDVGLGSVENTALSTWAGSTNITILGTISSGTWSATTIAVNKGGTGQITANAALNALLPTQTGQSGKFLSTNGTDTSWATPAGGGSGSPGGSSGDIQYNNAGSFAGVTAVAIANGGTGQVTASAGFDALSPMTILGDVIYGATSGSGTRLAGNTTTTKKFITQTGDGTISAAPSWSVVSSTDVGLGSVENTALSTWAGTTNITTLGTITSGTWSATTIALTKGGTGQTTASAAFNALSPVTTLGDIIYGSGSNANSRLAGNTTTTKKFITQTGDGTNSAAPSWGTVTSTDVGLGSVENTALSTWAGSTNITTLGTITSGTWSATTVAIAKGGTGQTTASAAFDALSPMTTLGDVIYGGASGTRTRLAGNTTTTKKFLTQTGDSTNSVAPSWGTVTSTDVGLGSVENTALSTWAGSTNLTTLGTITSGTWSATTIGLTKGGTGQTTANAALNALLPSQGSSSGKFLTTNGTDSSWGTPAGGGGNSSATLPLLWLGYI